MKKYLPSMIWGTLAGLCCLLLGLAGVTMFFVNFNVLFLLLSLLGFAAVVYILFRMKKRKDEIDEESKKEKNDEKF